MILTPAGSLLENSTCPSFFTENNTFSYSDLQLLVYSYKGSIVPNTICIACSDNSFSMLAFYLACLNNNNVLILVPPDIPQNNLHQLISTYCPSAIYCPTKIESDIKAKQASLLNLYLFSSFYRLDGTSRLPALLLPTSGSTGKPKLVKVSHENLKANTLSIIKYLGINSESRHITSLPFSYTYGLSSINTHISRAASIILTDTSIITKTFWDLVSANNPTTFSGVPYTYSILSRFTYKRLAATSIEYYTQAGGKMSADTLDYFVKFATDYNKQFIVMYGQTEATARMSYMPFSMLADKPTSIGIAIPFGSFSLDYSKSPISCVDKYQVGELIYSGPNVTHGYASTLDTVPITDTPEYLRTGDLAYADEDGFYYIVGRLSRFSKINGIRLSLDLVQSLLPKDSAVVSDDHSLFIYYETLSFDKASLLEQLSATFKLPKGCFIFRQIDILPRNEAGKIVYSSLLIPS